MLKLLQKQCVKLYVFVICMVMFFYFGNSALTNTEQTAKSKPDVTYSNPYFKGTKEEREAQVKRISALFGVECNFCHNEDLTVFTEEGDKSKMMMKASVALGVRPPLRRDGGHDGTARGDARPGPGRGAEIMGTECS